MNQAQVLDLIRTGKATSRKALADVTGLSATASGAIVKSLIQDGYIHEIGEGESSGGRKPVILKLRPQTHYAIGFDIDRHFIHAVALDSTGEIRFNRKHGLAGALPAERIVDLICVWCDEVMNRLHIGPEHLLGIGLSVPGLVDRRTHEVVLAPNLGWRNVRLRELLEARIDTTVDIENESMCSATCEHWIGSCRDVGDFICINVDSGIGAGIYIGGKLYRGASGSAGEVGHVIVDDMGPACSCGNRGCLETLASVDGMLDQLADRSHDIGRVRSAHSPHSVHAVKSNTDALASDLRTADLRSTGESADERSADTLSVEEAQRIAFDSLLSRARQGDPDASAVMETAARSLGKAVGTLINILNPARVILGKRFPEMGAEALERVKQEAERTALGAPASESLILPSRFGMESSAIGAAIFPIRRLFGQ